MVTKRVMHLVEKLEIHLDLNSEIYLETHSDKSMVKRLVEHLECH